MMVCSIRSIGQPATSLLSSPQLWLIWLVTSACRLAPARAIRVDGADDRPPATEPVVPPWVLGTGPGLEGRRFRAAQEHGRAPGVCSRRRSVPGPCRGGVALGS